MEVGSGIIVSVTTLARPRTLSYVSKRVNLVPSYPGKTRLVGTGTVAIEVTFSS